MCLKSLKLIYFFTNKLNLSNPNLRTVNKCFKEVTKNKLLINKEIN